jgi:hypothetical protein
MVRGESVRQYRTQGLTKQTKQASLRGQDPLEEQRVPRARVGCASVL